MTERHRFSPERSYFDSPRGDKLTLKLTVDGQALTKYNLFTP